MAQTTTGLRAVFSLPWMYDAFQALMGADRVRRELVGEFIRPRAGDCILDLGCGTADIVAYLPPDVRYWGYDISEDYIQAARARFGPRGTFECRLVDDELLETLPPMDAVLALGVLHHLDDAEAESFVALARRALKPGGRLVTIDPVFASPQNPIARFLISRDRGRNVREARGYEAIARSAFSRVQGTMRHRAWIPYTQWFMECTP